MTVISIGVDSTQQNPSGGTRRVPEGEITAIASACAKLLDELGSLRSQVEVLKVVSWHGYNQPNIFDIKAVLSMRGDESAKVEAKRTFEQFSSNHRTNQNWDLSVLSSRIVSDMKREIYGTVKRRIYDLSQVKYRWEKLLPETENV